MLGIINVCDHTLSLKKGRVEVDPTKNEVLRTFVSAKDISAGRFLFRSHLSSGKRFMTSRQLDTQILGRLMIPMVRGKFTCRFCNNTITTFHSAHAEECNKVTNIDTSTNLVTASSNHPN